MNRICTLFFAVPIVVGFSAQALMHAHQPPRKGQASKVSATNAKRLDKKLSDFGITPRALAYWKTTGGAPDLSFLEATFRKPEARPTDFLWRKPEPSAFMDDGMALNGFELQTRDYFSDQTYRTLVLIRLNKNCPQASKDNGKTWVDGEQSGEAWLFAFDNQTLSLLPADEAFQIQETKAWAFEKSVVTKTGGTGRFLNAAPYFHSAVLAAAYGRNEMQALIKYPGSDFVVAIKGIRWKDRWVGRSQGSAPFNGGFLNERDGGGYRFGVFALEQGRCETLFELNGDRLLLGTSRGSVNYGIQGDITDQLAVAEEFGLAKGQPLPDIADAYKQNFTRAIWTKSDEDESFSRMAEKAFFGKGLTAWFYTPLISTGFQTDVDTAERNFRSVANRIKAMGGHFSLIMPR